MNDENGRRPRLGPKRPANRSGSAPDRKGSRRAPSSIGIRLIKGDEFVLVQPPCVEERELDVEEGLELWKEGEFEAARDSLRYALQGCPDNLVVHEALGRIALKESRDAELARGHFGYAFELVERALPPGFRGRFPADRLENRVLFETIDGLATCHEILGRSDLARELRGIAKRWSGRGGNTPDGPREEPRRE